MNIPIFTPTLPKKMIRVVIVDDEPHVRDGLIKLIGKHCPNVTLVGTAGSVREGKEVIRRHHPDLVLLDIKMDDGTGFDLLKQLDPVDFKVIFITAYEQYAVKAFKFSALDYILKPVDPDELTEAITRTELMLQHDLRIRLSAMENNLASDRDRHKKLVLNTADNIFIIEIPAITHCESDGSYTVVFLEDGRKIMASRNLKEYDDMLSDQGFYRIHKSFLINLAFVERFDKAEGGFVVLRNGARIPVASRKRDQLLEMFDHLGDY
ncbi:MAG TPA: LytTR family DNA-binding domain-containing protein [Bacteroidales bacterium]|nr:LytTR family DNA-binding domain-containing protein [Bacteroidales bacterium]